MSSFGELENFEEFDRRQLDQHIFSVDAVTQRSAGHKGSNRRLCCCGPVQSQESAAVGQVRALHGSADAGVVVQMNDPALIVGPRDHFDAVMQLRRHLGFDQRFHQGDEVIPDVRFAEFPVSASDGPGYVKNFTLAVLSSDVGGVAAALVSICQFGRTKGCLRQNES